MNPSIVERICDDAISFDKKVRLPKKLFNRHKRRNNYAKNMALFAQAAQETGINQKKFANFERRKQHKVRFDTWRRQEVPTKEDIKLENIHYANFLGDKYGDNGSPYNTHCKVNLRFCDSMADVEEPIVSFADDEDSFTRQARLVYGDFDSDRDDQSLSDISLGSNDSLDLYEEQENPAKFSGKQVVDWDDLPISEEEANRNYEEEIFEEMVAYMRRQVELAESIIGVKRSYNEIGGTAKRARCDDESNNV
jgi:hypothetical protein